MQKYIFRIHDTDKHLIANMRVKLDCAVSIQDIIQLYINNINYNVENESAILVEEAIPEDVCWIDYNMYRDPDKATREDLPLFCIEYGNVCLEGSK